MLALLLGGVATFATGAWIGSVVDDATEKTPVQIITQSANVDNGTFSLNKSDLIKYGALGLVAFYIYKKYLKK